MVTPRIYLNGKRVERLDPPVGEWCHVVIQYGPPNRAERRRSKP